jgi:hypothetical protein
MATMRIIRMSPGLFESYINAVQALLNSSDHGAAISGMNLVIAMIEAELQFVWMWAQFAGPFTNIFQKSREHAGDKGIQLWRV